ncbi:transcription intermediary factor 1-alpha-like isoform X2 [Dendronephthya gigantea]|uniref:transcription intermediary factor 1-alpha-like isoform X2 n=1 Tax=Dendronephthya gigantea TaxID=151771 RepID=UPI00106A3AF5|nr:transcription intermediary factor 1-alpha-like isoform X2 [Dendronephthya gigantea]
MARISESDGNDRFVKSPQCTACRNPASNDPRTLPCFHSICNNCLQDVVTTCRDTEAPRGRPVRDFLCPCCLNETLKPKPDKQDRGVPCSHNCSQSYSVARCVTCEKFLCQECLTDHNKYRGNTGHSVLMMKELPKQTDEMYCNEHPGEILKVYCKTCDQLICWDCMRFIHVKQNHTCFLVENATSKYKEILALKSRAMEKVVSEGNTFVKRLTRTTERLDQDAKDAKSKILQRNAFMAKKVVDVLNQRTERLLNEVDEIHKGARAKLDRQTKATRQYVQDVQSSVDRSKELVKQGTEEEIISSQKLMLDTADNLLKKRHEHLRACIPLAKLCYTSYSEEEPLNVNILNGLEGSLGVVDIKSEDKDSSESPSVQSVQYSQATAFSISSYQSPSGVPGIKFVEVDGNHDDKQCTICLSDYTNKKTLSKCGHSFCASCIDQAFKYQKRCPICGEVYGPLEGNQPPGEMIEKFESTCLPGFPMCGTIVITYRFPSGIQSPGHPRPGRPYTGTNITAYLPENYKGREIFGLLKKAFCQKLTFTIGNDDCVVFNSIHHKTKRDGGPDNNGYPDQDYLRRVQYDLAVTGVN